MDYDAFDAGIELGGLRNRDDIRLLICYLLKSVESPMTRQMLNDAMQEDGLANYFEVGQAIEELMKTGNIVFDLLLFLFATLSFYGFEFGLKRFNSFL